MEQGRARLLLRVDNLEASLAFYGQQLGWELLELADGGGVALLRIGSEKDEVVLASQAAGKEAVTEGALVADIDRASRDVIEDAGLGERFTHSTGHGVGLEIHEAPRVAGTTRDTLTARDVVTVEPGVYLSGVGGVRIEDTVVVTPGSCDVLTLTPKELVL